MDSSTASCYTIYLGKNSSLTIDEFCRIKTEKRGRRYHAWNTARRVDEVDYPAVFFPRIRRKPHSAANLCVTSISIATGHDSTSMTHHLREDIARTSRPGHDNAVNIGNISTFC